MKIIEILKTHSWKILAVIFFVGFLSKGCTNNKIAKINKNLELHNKSMVNSIDSLTSVVSNLEKNTLKSKEARDIMEKVMLDYLIYEDDLDKGKISLSQIKNKIENND